MREKWNDGWLVWKEDNAFRLIFSVPKDAAKVDLPYDAAFHQPQNRDSLNAGRTGFLDGGVFNYYKEYDAEPGDKNKKICLLFEGVMGRASVYVNCSLAGENDYAYSEFYVDIGRWLRYGETNQILVMVNAMDMGSRYYCGAGICRDVWLIKQGAVRLIPESLRCTTLDVDGDLAVVRVELDVENTLPRMVEGVLNITVGSVCRERVRVNLPGRKCSHITRRLALEGIIPWSEDTPELYDIAAELLDADGAPLDDDAITTGFRVISVDAKRGLRVNGKMVKLRGACIHHDQGPLGAATYDSWEYYRVRTLKEAGFNAVRCAHNPASKALLRACDELGFTFETGKLYTLDDLEALFTAYKEKYGDGYYCVAGTTSSSEFFNYNYDHVDNMGNGTGGFTDGGLIDGVNKDDTTIVDIYASDAYMEYAKKMYDWAQKGFFSSDAATNTDSGTA